MRKTNILNRYMLFDKHLKNPHTYHITNAHERKKDHDCETINKIQIVDGE